MPINFIKRWIKRILIMLFIIALTLAGVRIYDTQRGAPLQLWHTYVPDELDADEIDHVDWNGYLLSENITMEGVYKNVVQRIDRDQQVQLNRYYEGSVVYPEHFNQNWNRSYIMMPEGKPKGAVVLLHGLTDTPYSLRHIAEEYTKEGFVAVGIRLPGHGTVPAGLTSVRWQDWVAATRLAVREAKQLSGPDLPLHMVGFSTGGTLALNYALDSKEDPTLAKPQQLTLVSPMIGITSFARFAGLAGLPAVFPPFSKAAWLSVVPEFNPFKYNSFPVNGARQSYLLTDELQTKIVRLSREGKLDNLPRVLTFQSVVDFTVSTRAVINDLYNYLPMNGSKLVLFDINRLTNFQVLVRPSVVSTIDNLLPQTPRNYQVNFITNESPATNKAVVKITNAGETTETITPLNMEYSQDRFSMSHVSIPFPDSDPLYGSKPDDPEQYGINLGRLAVRGERLVLVVDLDALLRASSNPFFPYVQERIDESIAQSLRPQPADQPVTAPAH